MQCVDPAIGEDLPFYYSVWLFWNLLFLLWQKTLFSLKTGFLYCKWRKWQRIGGTIRYLYISGGEKNSWCHVTVAKVKIQSSKECMNRSHWPRPNAGIVVRFPLKVWRSVCAFILCVGSGLATGWSPLQGALPTVLRIKKLKKRAKSKGYRAIERERKRTNVNVLSTYVLITELYRHYLLSYIRVGC
jgi:hypothetical protein